MEQNGLLIMEQNGLLQLVSMQCNAVLTECEVIATGVKPFSFRRI